MFIDIFTADFEQAFDDRKHLPLQDLKALLIKSLATHCLELH